MENQPAKVATMINDTKQKLVVAINESKLPASILELILQGMLAEIHVAAIQELAKEQEGAVS